MCRLLCNRYVRTPPPTSDQLWVRSQNSFDPSCRVTSGSCRLTSSPNQLVPAKCQRQRPARNSVGIFYAPVLLRFSWLAKNSRKQPFVRIGTLIATTSASTWFHARKGRKQRFSGPAVFAPSLFSGFGRQQFLQLATFEHLHHDVRSADEFAFHIELRDRRPVRIFLDPRANFLVLQHVDSLVLRAEPIEDCHGATGKAALRKQGSALHEQHDIVLLHKLCDAARGRG